MPAGYMMKYEKKTPITFKKKTPVTKKIAKLSVPVKKAVNKMITNRFETKQQEFTSNSASIFHVINDARVFNLIPNFSQGVGQGERIGDQITMKKCYLGLNIYLDPTALEKDTPHYIDVYIFKCKKSNFIPPSATDMTRFLQKGNSADAYNGDAFDGLRKLNSSLFILKKHLRYNMINSATVTNLNGQSNFPSNKSVIIDITKYFKKKQIFDDTSTNQSINDNLYIGVGQTNYNQIATPADVAIGAYDFFINYTFSDA